MKAPVPEIVTVPTASDSGEYANVEDPDEYLAVASRNRAEDHVD